MNSVANNFQEKQNQIMKKIFTLLSIFVLAISIFSSCKKQEAGITTTQNIYATIRTGETYQYTIESNSNNQSVNISQQASHFSKSETEVLATTNGPSPTLYNYIPAAGFVGTDVVQITVTDGENDEDNDQNGDHHDGNCGQHEDSSNDMGYHDGGNGKEMGYHEHGHHNAENSANKTVYIIHINIVNGNTVR